MVIETLDPDPDSLEMLDPDPDRIHNTGECSKNPNQLSGSECVSAEGSKGDVRVGVLL